MKIVEKLILAGATAVASASTALFLLTGYIATIKTSITYLLGLGVTLLFLTPVSRILSNIEDPVESLTSFYTGRKTQITLTSLIFSLTSVSFLTGISIPVFDLLNFSFFASKRLFQQLQYLGSPLTGVGVFLYHFGRFYFHLFLVYSLTDTAMTLTQKLKLRLNEDELQASMIPFTGGKAEIEIYVVTGFHGFLRIPESFCKQCNLFYRAAGIAAEESERDVEIQVKSYWTRFLRPLLKGGYHAPVMLVNGKMVSQGYDVPEPDEVLEALAQDS
jgi:predicted Rdx family selenoprotein